MTLIRKFIPIPSEYQQTVAIDQANFPDEEISVQSRQWQDQHHQPTRIFDRWVGEQDGRIVSHGYISEEDEPLSLPGYQLHLCVHPAYQNLGYGSELYQHLRRMLHQYAPCRVVCQVREDQEHSRHFLEKRGFKPSQKDARFTRSIPFGSQLLNLSAHDQQLAELGITILSLQELQKQVPTWEKQLSALLESLAQEFPAASSSVRSEFFHQANTIHQTESFQAASVFIARYQQHWIGVAGVYPSLASQQRLVHFNTGVLRAYRRRGIASVLLLSCLNFAILHGFTQVEGDTLGMAAMERLYQRLGYQKQPIRIRYEARLE